MTEPIQTKIAISFTRKDVDVSEDLMPDLLEFSYEDKETAEADEIAVTLKDTDGKWASSFRPDPGEVVKAQIYAGSLGGFTGYLPCGTFFVDQMSCKGSPRTFQMRAVSIPLKSLIRFRGKSRAWEKTSLRKIAESIATNAGMELLFDSQTDPEYIRVDQSAQSDLKFLQNLCEDAGLSLKVTTEKLVVFDQESYEKKEPVKTLTLGTSPILSWSFESQQAETYKSCTVSYRDPKKKSKVSAGSYSLEQLLGLAPKPKTKNPAVMSFTYTDPEADDNGQEYVLKRRVKSVKEAEALAKATLRKLNQRSVRGQIDLIGDVDLLAGVVITVSGFGSFDGNFIVERASHRINRSGYTTSVTLRRANSEY